MSASRRERPGGHVGSAQVAVGEMKISANDSTVRIERGGESVVVRLSDREATAEGFGKLAYLKLRRPKTVEEIRADIRRLEEEMREFLVENRAANEAKGLPLVGPAAVSISEDILGLMRTYQDVTSPR